MEMRRHSTRLIIPELSLVVLIGASASGKSTFARRHFRPTEILSSDFCRAVVADDENDLSATNEAFEILHFISAKRLARGRLTVVDATNVQPEARQPLVKLAREYHSLPVAIVFNLPEKVCQERNRLRTDRTIPPYAIRQHVQQLRRSLRHLRREGFAFVYVLSSQEEVDTSHVERQPLWTDLRGERGPFDIIGDVHGCFDELTALLKELGYEITIRPSDSGENSYAGRHPRERKIILLGDLVDRGPNSPEVLRLAVSLVESGVAYCIPGNHDMKLLRALRGRNVQLTHGLAETLAQLGHESSEFKERVARFLDGLISHYVFDEGRLVVAHAGMKQEMQGRASGRARDFALYGETTGEVDEFGLPVRYNWAEEYRGRGMVVYGHTPVPEPIWLNRTINIDTGCAFGGRLTALRYPEKELVSVPAARTYYQPVRPFLPEGALPALATARADELLDIGDVLGKRIITTRLHGNVTVREENSRAALEVMSRFAVDPKWLIYLPPTMSPTETTSEPGLLEHPAEAFAYYLHQGVGRVVCQEKHMGSRAVIAVSRSVEAARRRFGTDGEAAGICFTRTGRPFFGDPAMEAALLERLRAAMDASAMWEEFKTDWFCLDCEVMPWSFKAEELLRRQYAAVGSASRNALIEAVAALEGAAAQNRDIVPLLDRHRARGEMAARYVDAYRRYNWSVTSVQDLRVAPFHLLASEGGAHVDRDHLWHMETLAGLARADGERHPGAQVFIPTVYRVVDVTDAASQEEAIRWWEDLTARGSEGIVVKPLEFIVKGPRGLIQPALKSRGREYLRIIYGPEYTAADNLERLRERGLSRKRSLALREFALGIEALERFVRREPLYRVHECVFGVLALESDPVDPRL
jgi:protein phosphatase